jgi:hypothetical protein
MFLDHQNKMPISEASISDSSLAVRNDQPFRPIQYLGNKLRTLPDILNASENLIGKSGTVVDLFTGTTVVAQGFARRGPELFESLAHTAIFQ